MKTKDLVKSFQLDLRHKSGVKQEDFVKAYCEVLREHAYASPDDSWNELEKTLVHVLGMMVYYRRALEILGVKDSDPRDFVNEYEECEEKLANLTDGFLAALEPKGVE